MGPRYVPPPGMGTSSILFLMHQNSALWGNNVFELDPERIKEHIQSSIRYLLARELFVSRQSPHSRSAWGKVML